MPKRRPGGDTAVPFWARKALQKMRARLKNWSAEKDRRYHESLFQAQDYNPFTFNHPGYITILRFADLVSPYLANLERVLDLGCGPAEITCELARRHPGAAFFGVDHSPAGIKRARENAQSLSLKNISFEVADIETFTPAHPVDIVTMFDVFHHLVKPEYFIQRFQVFSPRFLFIEPRGDWKGSWRRDIDLDWLVREMEKIRARLAYAIGEKEPPAASSSPSAPKKEGAAVEHRYTLADFQRLFKGFGLTVRGTVSGLDAYPPGSHLPSPTRRLFNELACKVYAEADEVLRERQLDLLAKHWVIYAEKGKPGEEIKIPARLLEPPLPTAFQGPYDVEYLEYDGPREAKAGERIRSRVRLKNRSYRVWTSRHIEAADYLSYHWLDKAGAVILWDGDRTPLPRDVGPDEECEMISQIKAPDRPGRFVLELDLVQETKAWFSQAGSPGLRLPFRIRKR